MPYETMTSITTPSGIEKAWVTMVTTTTVSFCYDKDGWVLFGSFEIVKTETEKL